MIHPTRRQALAVAAGLIAVRPAFADETTLQRARREKRIRVGIFNQPPWGYRTPDGMVTGEAPDVLRAALAPLGIETVEPVITDFSALIPSLLANRLDVVACGLYVNPARCKLVLFGNPDLQMGGAALVLAGNPLGLHSYPDLVRVTTARIALNRGGVEAQYIEAAGIAKDRVSLFPDNQSAIAGLKAGRVDVVIGTAASLAYILETTKDKAIERATPFAGWTDASGVEVKGYPAAAFRPADIDLCEAYNAELQKLRADGGLLKILNRYGFGEAELPPEGLTAAKVCGPG